MGAKEIDQLKSLKKAIEEKKPSYESFVESHTPLVQTAEVDTEKVVEEVALTTERWNKLTANLDQRSEYFNGLNAKLGEIDEIIEPIEELVSCCEQTVENLAPIGMDQEKGKDQISELEKLLDDLGNKEEDLKIAEKLTDELSQQPGVNAQ